MSGKIQSIFIHDPTCSQNPGAEIRREIRTEVTDSTGEKLIRTVQLSETIDDWSVEIVQYVNHIRYAQRQEEYTSADAQ